MRHKALHVYQARLAVVWLPVDRVLPILSRALQMHGQTQRKHETRDQNMLHASSSRMAAKYSLPSGSLVSRYTSCTRQL